MRRYYISLLVVSLILVLTTFIILWAAPHVYITAMPLLVLYFTVLTAVQHYVVVRAMQRSPKTFVQIFLGTTIGALFLHLIVIAVYVLSYFETWRPFLLTFAVCFVVYLAFETVALVRYIDRAKKNKD